MKEQYGLIPTWQSIDDKQHPLLADNEVHLWCLPLKLRPSQQEAALSLLSDIQKDKYHRRKSASRREVYLAGRYYLLTLLGQYTSTPAGNVLLSYSSLNKPYLSDKNQNIQFNFTDTTFDQNSYGLFVFCRHRLLGVDIESLNRVANFSEISDKRFSPEEQQFVTNHDGKINPQRCLAIWTRKEAFGKAIGKGINFKMNVLNLASPDAYKLDFVSHDEDWHLQQIQLPNDFISCIAYQGHQALDIKAFNCANHLP